MGRKCSHCGNIGHNSRTCTSYRGGNVNVGSSNSSRLRLFGVQLDQMYDSNSSPTNNLIPMTMIKKSISMDCFSSPYHPSLPRPLTATSSPSPSSSSLSSSLVGNTDNKSMPVGYLSDGLLARAQERKKGLPWTEEEHRRFLVGLQKLGKGDWRGISRNFVTTRTPTQVASHAQKYFLRQANLVSKKRRSSLFDLVEGRGGNGAVGSCTLGRRSSYEEGQGYNHKSKHLPIMIDLNSFGQEIQLSRSLDLELTLASPEPIMDQNKHTPTSSLLFGPIISVV